ncbi:MAG: hypothetical protein MR711_02770 [Selenomonas sp.]|uniref:hypothetical protein n=1 Tax=Selenomonas sp. TaxID=2053611 RepID=UPI0025EC9A7B|nr:hypothetical protein [Selenomonas sp.]MCI6085172.1 hypothetical protein [Selenomonas sp.]
MLLKRFLFAAGVCSALLCGTAVTSPLPVASAYSIDNSYGYDLIIGTWRDRDGGTLSITDSSIGMASYTIHEVTKDDARTSVCLYLNGGKSVVTLTFVNGNHTYMMLNNVQTGYSKDYSKI